MKRLIINLLLWTGLFFACSPMDANYADIIKDGKIVYAGKATEPKVLAGHNRVMVTCLLTGDPNIEKMEIYWNAGRDSTSFPVDRLESRDIVSTIIDDLEEGNYSFELYTFDKFGNSSIKTTVSGRAYGTRYQQSLMPRTVRSASGTGTDQVDVHWFSAEEGAVGTEVEYMGTLGAVKRVIVPVHQSHITLYEFPEGESFKHRTLFLPEPEALDTFKTDYTTEQPLFERELDKSLFSAVHLPTDSWESRPNAGMGMEGMWDGVSDRTVSTSNFQGLSDQFPQWFTIDLGVTAQLTRMKLWHKSQLFNQGNLMDFEIWGSNDPDDETGSWDNWVKILSGSVEKPSGLPLGQLNNVDRQYNDAGMEFSFDEGIDAYRFLRVKVIEAYRQPNFRFGVSVQELSFWQVN